MFGALTMPRDGVLLQGDPVTHVVWGWNAVCDGGYVWRKYLERFERYTYGFCTWETWGLRWHDDYCLDELQNLCLTLFV